jgi:hypothetical protein
MSFRASRFSWIACAIILANCAASASAEIISYWTFETSVPTTAGPHVAESGINAATSEASGSTGGTFSNPAGNGNGFESIESFSSTAWDPDDFWQFKFPTTGSTGLTLTFDQAGSNTGPKTFKVATSTDGMTFTDLPAGGYSVAASTWNTAPTPMPGFTHSFSLPVELENLPFAYVRLVNTSPTTGGAINGGNVGSGGTNRIDNVQIADSTIPEPATVSLLAMIGLAGSLAGRRFRR